MTSSRYVRMSGCDDPLTNGVAFGERIVAATCQPLFANSNAAVLPMPLLAPVMSTVLSFLCTTFSNPQLASRVASRVNSYHPVLPKSSPSQVMMQIVHKENKNCDG